MAPYEITVDATRHTLRIALHGFWDTETANRYLTDLAIAARQVSRAGAANWWLINLGQAQVQSLEVAAMLGEQLPTMFTPATTVAVVAYARLPSVQARRVVPNDHHRHFHTLTEAEHWLREQGMPG